MSLDHWGSYVQEFIKGLLKTMNLDALYNQKIKKAAQFVTPPTTWENAQLNAKKRSPTCGSVIEICAQSDGTLITRLGLDASKACLLSQAACAVLLKALPCPFELKLAQEGLETITAFLNGKRLTNTHWKEFEIFTPAIDFRSRHPSIKLPFQTLMLLYI